MADRVSADGAATGRARRLEKRARFLRQGEGCRDRAPRSVLWRRVGGYWRCVNGIEPLASAGLEKAIASGIDGAQALSHWLGGDQAALRDFELRTGRLFDFYLKQRESQYATERRWAGNAFWRSSHRRKSVGVRVGRLQDGSERESIRT